MWRELWTGRKENWGCSPGDGADFFLLHSVATGSGVHTAPYPMGTGRYFLEAKQSQLATALHLMPRLRIFAALSLFSTRPHDLVLN
jgi:hypothetical protein